MQKAAISQVVERFSTSPSCREHEAGVKSPIKTGSKGPVKTGTQSPGKAAVKWPWQSGVVVLSFWLFKGLSQPIFCTKFHVIV